MTPFVVLALPRSRTKWLSVLLSYGQYHCEHEQLRHLRTLEDARTWLSQNWTGTAETSAGPWWRLIRRFRPDARILIVRRPVDEVVDSLMRLNMQGVCIFDRAKLIPIMQRFDRALDRAEQGLANVLSVRFADLADEAVCARVFEHCLGYPFDADWWADHDARNIQASMPALMRYMLTHKPALDRAAVVARRQMRSALGAKRTGPLAETDEGVVIREEDLEEVWRTGEANALFSEHCKAVGEPEDQYTRKNIAMIRLMNRTGAMQFLTARSNGRMLGYLLSVIAPSLEAPDLMTATQTLFFVSADAVGLRIGVRLQQAAIELAKSLGIGEVYMRSGVRGSGPKLDVLYRRAGAEPCGQLFKLNLKAA